MKAILSLAMVAATVTVVSSARASTNSGNAGNNGNGTTTTMTCPPGMMPTQDVEGNQVCVFDTDTNPGGNAK